MDLLTTRSASSLESTETTEEEANTLTGKIIEAQLSMSTEL
jgi:hypothetical protein